MFALDYQLNYILNVEGLENRFKRHIEMADIVGIGAESILNYFLKRVICLIH